MASREGARVRGTDGSDFGHRETVASHYHTSAENKRRLKLVVVFHTVLAAYGLVKLSSDILLLFGLDLKDTYDVTIPKSAVWEWIWVTCYIFVLPLFFAIRKNNVTAMKLFVAGICICGILPLIWAATNLLVSGELKTFILKGAASKEVEKFNGVPVVMVTTSFVALGFIIHLAYLIFARNLIVAWSPKKGKRA